MLNFRDFSKAINENGLRFTILKSKHVQIFWLPEMKSTHFVIIISLVEIGNFKLKFYNLNCAITKMVKIN